jgi:hypothetical protein
MQLRLRSRKTPREFSSHDMDGDQYLGKNPLQSIFDACASIQNASLDEVSIKKHKKRGRKPHPTDLVGRRQLLVGPGQQVISLLLRIFLLGRYPSGERFSVIMEYFGLEASYRPIERHTMAMPLIVITGRIPQIQHGSRRVQGPAKRPPIHAIDKSGSIAHDLVAWTETLYFVNELVADFIIGVEGEHPARLYL